MDNHTQCLLKRGNERYTAWIPSKFAIVGDYIKYLENRIWSDGWRVEEVYNQLPSNVVFERSQDYKKTRKASDI